MQNSSLQARLNMSQFRVPLWNVSVSLQTQTAERKLAALNRSDAELRVEEAQTRAALKAEEETDRARRKASTTVSSAQDSSSSSNSSILLAEIPGFQGELAQVLARTAGVYAEHYQEELLKEEQSIRQEMRQALEDASRKRKLIEELRLNVTRGSARLAKEEATLRDRKFLALSIQGKLEANYRQELQLGEMRKRLQGELSKVNSQDSATEEEKEERIFKQLVRRKAKLLTEQQEIELRFQGAGSRIQALRKELAEKERTARAPQKISLLATGSSRTRQHHSQEVEPDLIQKVSDLRHKLDEVAGRNERLEQTLENVESRIA